MDLLRFLTAGNVDDGKSTLIGRLLYDSNSVSTDILQAAEKASKGKNLTDIDLSLLTDGLRAEREQGITIDVAYKYFTTPKRKFIIADTPGHVQYTRNMVTGASNSNLAIILIDARNGITEQTTRHSIISSLFGIQHLAVCINKMDLVSYDQKIYDEIVKKYSDFARKLTVKDITFIPVSAKLGDNVVEKSKNMNWYDGRTLLDHLERVEVESDLNFSSARFPVQYVIRPQQDEHHDYRGYAGKVVSGIFKQGDEVEILPAGHKSRIKEIELADQKLSEVRAPQSVVMHLEDDLDISRGDTIAIKDDSLVSVQEFEATVCWMNERPLNTGSKYLLRHHGKEVKAVIRNVLYKIDAGSMEHMEDDKVVKMNEIAKIELKTASPIVADRFAKNHANGHFILIDENTNETVGGGVYE